jgi:cytochrome P450
MARRQDDLWRSLRAAWQPAFSSTSLEGYTGLMDACATKLCGVLEGAAAEGRVVDMHREIGKMTMGVR